MYVCSRIVDIIETVLRFIVFFITTVLRTVCELVSSILTFMKEVCDWVESKLCGWLPWPFNKLCKWVTKLVCKVIEVVKEVWDWVCETIVEFIISFIERFVTVFIYLLRWVCFFVDMLILRWWQILLCRAGIKGQRFMPVCPVILRDERGNQSVTEDQVQAWLRSANVIFEQCNITLVLGDIRVLTTDFSNNNTCEFGGIFSGFFDWFSRHANPNCITIYFVNNIDGACGCAFPNANWVTVSGPRAGCNEDNIPCVIAQEIGHLGGLWAHSDTEGNVMASPCGDNFTEWQCCMLWTSRFVTSAQGRVTSAIGAIGRTRM